jgi:chemotaxis protein MotB
MSFCDLLTLLLCFFLALISTSARDEAKTRKAIGSLLGAFGVLPGGKGFDSSGRFTSAVEAVSISSEQTLFTTFEAYFDEEVKVEGGADIYVDEQGRKRIRFTESFLFATGSSRFHPRTMPVFDRLAAMLTELGRPVEIEGHTDATRGRESNWRLSAARAQAVMRYLEVAGNLDPNLLTAVGFADSRPVAGLSPKDARNRRVEIVVSKPVETPAATPAAPATPATASTTATAATPATTVSPDAADAPATEGGH